MTDRLDHRKVQQDEPAPEGGNDAPGDAAGSEDDKSPWLKTGAGAPDAADIEEPDVQR